MNNPLDFSGKVALITGAAAGMGLATAQAFAQAGAAVVLADFKEEAVKAAAQKLTAAGHRALAVRCDVSDDSQVAAMVDRTAAEFGRLDAVFNNAGVMACIAPIADSAREDWDRVIGINLRGVWSCMKHELRQMELSRHRRDRQQRLGRRLDRQPRHCFLHRLQTRGGRPGAGASTTACSQARQAYLGRCVTITRNWQPTLTTTEPQGSSRNSCVSRAAGDTEEVLPHVRL
jgi:NAD(P)-dependent dehydrogenase (short-subunit alcohol dehydrogenase family)